VVILFDFENLIQLIDSVSLVLNDNKRATCESFYFLIANMFFVSSIKPISNNGWLLKGNKSGLFGEQPINAAYTIMRLKRFYDVFGDEVYRSKMEISFSWFSGNNHLHKIIYNTITGSCYNGLEESLTLI